MGSMDEGIRAARCRLQLRGEGMGVWPYNVCVCGVHLDPIQLVGPKRGEEQQPAPVQPSLPTGAATCCNAHMDLDVPLSTYVNCGAERLSSPRLGLLSHPFAFCNGHTALCMHMGEIDPGQPTQQCEGSEVDPSIDCNQLGLSRPWPQLATFIHPHGMPPREPSTTSSGAKIRLVFPYWSRLLFCHFPFSPPRVSMQEYYYTVSRGREAVKDDHRTSMKGGGGKGRGREENVDRTVARRAEERRTMVLVAGVFECPLSDGVQASVQCAVCSVQWRGEEWPSDLGHDLPSRR